MIELFLYYGLWFVVYVLINVSIYGSAFWLTRKFFQSAKRKYYLLIWPTLLIAVNLCAVAWMSILSKNQYNQFEKGVVYDRKIGVDTIYLSGGGYKLSAELLLEGHVKRIVALNNEGRSRLYEKSSNPNCLIENNLDDSSIGDAMHFYRKRCVDETWIDGNRVADLKGLFESENAVLIRINHLSLSEIQPRFDLTHFKTGTEISDVNEGEVTEILSKRGKLLIDTPIVPLIIVSLSTDMEQGPFGGIDNFKTFRRYYDPSLKRHADSSIVDDLRENTRANSYKLIKETLGIELDGSISGGENLPSLSVTKAAIRKTFDNAGNWQRTAGKPPVYEFAKLYDGYPFVDVFTEYKTDYFDWVSDQADKYLQEAWCHHNSEICDLIEE